MYISTNINNNILILSLIFAQATIVYETYLREKGMPSTVSTHKKVDVLSPLLSAALGVTPVIGNALNTDLMHLLV